MAKRKLSKTQLRKKRKRKKELKSKQHRQVDSTKQKPWEPVKMSLYELPDIFPSDLTPEQRKKAIREIGRKAQKEFDQKFASFGKWFQDFDALYLLSFCAAYFLTCPEGTDPETRGYFDFAPYILELMQAFALMQERSYSPDPLLGKSDQLLNDVKEIDQAMQHRLLDLPEELKTDEELNAYMLQTEMMAATTAIRNWAYIYQMKRITFELARQVNKKFQSTYGLDAEKTISVLFSIVSSVEDRFNEHRDKVRTIFNKDSHIEIMQIYNDVFPDNVPTEKEKLNELWDCLGRDLDAFRSTLICHSDLKLESIYTFSLDELVSIYGDKTKTQQIQNIFDKWSYKFGDLKNHNIKHFVLDNPIHAKPFIKIEEEKYYCAAIGILPHFAISLLEGLIFEDESWKHQYTSKIKSKYLEDQVEKLFLLHFPSAKVYRGSLWEAQNNILYENDLLVVLDNFAIVVESKSGMVTPPAKRGLPKRLAHTLQKLIVEPGLQANRFIEYLKTNKKQHQFQTKREVVNDVDNTSVDYYIPLTVTLAEMGAICSNIKKLINSGFVQNEIQELAPSISLGALEIVFDLLSLEAHKIHYLARRREFESNVNYDGDELDLVGFYLDTGFNIGNTEDSGDILLNLTLKSKELDPYYIAKGEGIVVDKPKAAITQWWEDILLKIDSRRPKGWLEVSYILLSTSQDDQKEFEKLFEVLKQRVGKGRAHYKNNSINLTSGRDTRRFFISGCAYRSKSRDERNNMAADILSLEEAKSSCGAICISQDVKMKHYPYSMLGMKDKAELF